ELVNDFEISHHAHVLVLKIMAMVYESTSNYKTTNQIKKGIKNATNEENELHKTQINTTTSNYSNYYRLRHK
ncbi:MAG: hypothetical protein VYA54_06750, partial [Bdellovibrionota bacterium]|nr:hypothetical protein [Bdellovibrionota bacterium]